MPVLVVCIAIMIGLHIDQRRMLNKFANQANQVNKDINAAQGS